jgi:hypothetical protein
MHPVSEFKTRGYNRMGLIIGNHHLRFSSHERGDPIQFQCLYGWTLQVAVQKMNYAGECTQRTIFFSKRQKINLHCAEHLASRLLCVTVLELIHAKFKCV